jgi:hypothetical protein
MICARGATRCSNPATILRMAGCSLADIADLLGHRDLATTQIYATVQQEHLRAIVGTLTPLVTANSEPVSLKSVTRPGFTTQGSRKLLESKASQDRNEKVAERVGFEPTVEFPLHTLSKRA